MREFPEAKIRGSTDAPPTAPERHYEGGGRSSVSPRGDGMIGSIQVGAVVAERYEILAVVGQGGTGPVYKAHDRLLDETVALKTVGGEHGLRTLRTAARLAPRGGARQVGRIHDFGQHEGV